MLNDWLTEAARLHREGLPFVLATVVARRPPQSAHTGAKALIHPDGRMMGWIGGGCVRPTVLREALEALGDGRPRLVRVSPDERPEGKTAESVRVYPMICEGEGAVDVYIDPVLPAPRMIVIGGTPVAEAVVRLGHPLGFRIRVADRTASPDRFPGAEEVTTDLRQAVRDAGPSDVIVVATMGVGDEEALDAAVSVDAAYLGLVASRKKGQALLGNMERRGIDRARLDRVRCPAGLDLGGTSAAEIALSILAQIVEQRTRGSKRKLGLSAAGAAPDPGMEPAIGTAVEGSRRDRSQAGPTTVPAPITALDPVCGMAVEIAAARHTAVHDGRTVYFCCPHCKAAFERDPESYTIAAE